MLSFQGLESTEFRQKVFLFFSISTVNAFHCMIFSIYKSNCLLQHSEYFIHKLIHLHVARYRSNYQQDAHEALLKVILKLKENLESVGETEVIRDTFDGKITTKTVCSECSAISSTTDTGDPIQRTHNRKLYV